MLDPEVTFVTIEVKRETPGGTTVKALSTSMSDDEGTSLRMFRELVRAAYYDAFGKDRTVSVTYRKRRYPRG